MGGGEGRGREGRGGVGEGRGGDGRGGERGEEGREGRGEGERRGEVGRGRCLSIRCQQLTYVYIATVISDIYTPAAVDSASVHCHTYTCVPTPVDGAATSALLKTPFLTLSNL